MNAIAETLVACDLAEANGTLARLTSAQVEALNKARLRLMGGDAAAAHGVSLVLDRTIEIPVYRWAQVEREFSRLVAKAESRGLPVPLLTEVSRTERHVTAHVLGGAPVFGGWRLVADLERVTDQKTRERLTLVRTAVGETCPEQYRAEPEQCEHCGLGRTRNRTFVIAHEDGRMMQVGSTCLDEYLGAEALSAWLTLSKITAAADGWGVGVWDEGEFARYRGHASTWGRPIAVDMFLAAVAAEVRVHGYASARSQMHPDLATGRSVWAAIQGCEQTSVTEADVARGEVLREFGQALAGDSEFVLNVRAILASGEVRWADANTVAALMPLLVAQEARLDEHLPGAVEGEVVVGEWRVKAMPSYYSDLFMVWKYTVIFADADGREIVWRTTSPSCKSITSIDDLAKRRAAAEAHGSADVQVGETYRVVARVKALTHRGDFAQTEVTRASAYIHGTEPSSAKSAARKFAKTNGAETPEWAMTDAQRRRAAKSRA
jgi:hypothetical protein